MLKKAKKYIYLKITTTIQYQKSLSDVSKKFTTLTTPREIELRDTLKEDYFSTVTFEHMSSSYLESSEGMNDMNNHMYNRLDNFRKNTIPWLNYLLPLKNSKILEIGCGTGSTTVALAEQDCIVTSVDVNETHINVAKKRCQLHQVPANIKAMNAINIGELKGKFDFIIYSASLEHMTYDERIISIKAAWELIKDDGYLVVLETPNRLWYVDEHSSQLPFYNWLPNEIAIPYGVYSPRTMFSSLVANGCDNTKFIRFGRGVSFHEFEIALGRKCSLFEVNYMQSFIKPLIILKLFKSQSQDFKFMNFLKNIGPQNISMGFYQPSLYLAIKKK
jgi:S-adenosylmethionine-dependent methyltransferase